jgi:putative tricarboxylic transport membrane protein
VDVIAGLGAGFAVALRPENLLLCLAGCFWGTVVGVLPGLGPLAGLTLLLPLTFHLDPAAALIMLAGIFNGAMYGGSTTSILLRIPGEAASVVTCIDGYEMARKGRAGGALAIAALGSWVGGTVSVVGLMLFAPPLASLMLTVGPAAEFMLMALALVVVAAISGGSRIKAGMMALSGLLIASVGIDAITAIPRFTFGRIELTDGISFAALALGLFGISEILLTVERLATIEPIIPSFRSLLPTRRELREAAAPIGRGTLIGFVFGIIPGVSHVISTFVSYSVEKRVSKRPDEFGKGAVAGVAGPETANNATTGSGMIPLLVLGIPALPATTILLSAMMIHGIQPGPQLMTEHPEVFWGVIASLYVGNLMLLVLNLPLVGIFVNLLRVPYSHLAPVVLLLCIIGIYSAKSSQFEIAIMAASGAIGYVLRKLRFDVAPLLLAVVLGDRMEVSLRTGLMIADGDWLALFEGPAARVLLCAAAVLAVTYVVARRFGFSRAVAATED